MRKNDVHHPVTGLPRRRTAKAKAKATPKPKASSTTRSQSESLPDANVAEAANVDHDEAFDEALRQKSFANKRQNLGEYRNKLRQKAKELLAARRANIAAAKGKASAPGPSASSSSSSSSSSSFFLLL